MAQLTIKLSDGSHNTEQTLARKNPRIFSFKGDDVSCVWQNQTLTITNNVSGAEIFRLELADVQHIVFQGDLKQIPHKAGVAVPGVILLMTLQPSPSITYSFLYGILGL